MPAIGTAFDVGQAAVQLTFTSFFVGYAVSHLILGPLSDRFGRRPVLLAGMWLFLAADAACAVAGSIEILMVARFLQGFGACGGLVLGRAMVRDVYDRQQAAKILSLVGVLMVAAIALGPLIGGFLQVQFGWQASFWVVALVYAFVLALCYRRLPETHVADGAEDRIGILAGFPILLGSREFVLFALCAAFLIATNFVFLAASPIVLIERYGMSPADYGPTVIIAFVGTMIGNFASARLVSRLGVIRMIFMGLAFALVAVAVMIAIALTGYVHPIAVVGPIFFVNFGYGIAYPNALATSISVFPRIAGTGSAIMGFLQYGISALVIALIGILPHETQLTMGIVIAGLIVLSIVTGSLGSIVVRKNESASTMP